MTKGERIKYLRERIGMSQVALADKINVSKQTMYKYETDIVTNIPSDKIEAIAEVTHSSPAFIMGWIDNDQEDGQRDVYYVNKETADFAQLLHDRPDLRILLDAAQDCPPESVMALVPLAKKLKETNPNA